MVVALVGPCVSSRPCVPSEREETTRERTLQRTHHRLHPRVKIGVLRSTPALPSLALCVLRLRESPFLLSLLLYCTQFPPLQQTDHPKDEPNHFLCDRLIDDWLAGCCGLRRPETTAVRGSRGQETDRESRSGREKGESMVHGSWAADDWRVRQAKVCGGGG